MFPRAITIWRSCQPQRLLVVVGIFLVQAGALAQGVERVWSGPSGGYWHVAANWVPVGVPVIDDRVVITNGQVIITQSVTVADITLGGGGITGNPPTFFETVTTSVTNSFLWNAGFLDTHLYIGPSATMTIDVKAPRILTRQLVNQGRITWLSGALTNRTTAISNLAGATFEIVADTTLSGFGDSFLFNQGLLRKTGGSTVTRLSGWRGLHNAGKIEVQSGTLSFESVSLTNTATGIMETAEGASLEVRGGTLAAVPGGTFQGAGTNRIINARALFYGQYSGPPLEMIGGILGGTNYITAPFLWQGGSIGLYAGPALVTISSEAVWAGGTLYDRLIVASNGALTINSPTNVVLDGRLSNQGRITWIDGDILTHTGTTNIIVNGSNAVFDIQCDRVLSMTNLQTSTGDMAITNYGVLRKSAGTGTSFIQGRSRTRFRNYAVVEANSGTIAFDFNNALSLGRFHTEAGSTIELVTGGFSFLSGSEFTGTGTNRWSGAYFEGLLNAPHLEIGGLSGTNTVVCDVRAMGGNWSGDTTLVGKMDAQDVGFRGVVRIAAMGHIALSAANQTTFYGGTLVNTGKVSWLSGPIVAPSMFPQKVSAIRNEAGGLFEISGNANISDFSGIRYPPVRGFTFTNLGTLRKLSTSDGITAFQLVFQNFGTVELLAGFLDTAFINYSQFAGETWLDNGSIQGTFTMTGGTLTGSGGATRAYVTDSDLTPGNPFGGLAFDTLVLQGGRPRLNFHLGGTVPESGYDQIRVSGILNDQKADSVVTIATIADYRPQVGDSFEIMRFGARTNFSPQIAGLDLGDGLALSPTLTESNLTLTTIAVPTVTNSVAASLAAGAAQLVRFTGIDGQTCTLQTSTNLISWTDLCSGGVTNMVFQCDDPSAAQSPYRFYRARLGQ